MTKRNSLIAFAVTGIMAAAVVGALVFAFAGPVKRSPLSEKMVTEGEVAPAFTLEAAADGAMTSLADYRGSKNVLLYFSMAYG